MRHRAPNSPGSRSMHVVICILLSLWCRVFSYTSCTQVTTVGCENCVNACINSVGCGVCFWCDKDASCSSFDDDNLNCDDICAGIPISVPSPAPSSVSTSLPSTYTPTKSPLKDAVPSPPPSSVSTSLPSTYTPTKSPLSDAQSFVPSNSQFEPTAVPRAVPSFAPSTLHPPVLRSQSPSLAPTVRYFPTASPSYSFRPTEPAVTASSLSDWYFKTSSYSTHSPIVTAWFIQLVLWGLLTSLEIVLNWNNVPDDRIAQLEIFKEILMFALWSLFMLCWMCARFHFFSSTAEGLAYEPRIAHGGELIYVNEKWFEVSGEEIMSGGDGSNVPHCHYSQVHHAPDNTCSFIRPLGVDLLSKPYKQLSAGISLLIYISSQAAFMWRRASGRWKSHVNKREDDLLSTIIDAAFYFTVELLVGFQQYMALLPLTGISASEYCLHVDVPVHAKKAICEYQIIAAAIPFSIVTGIFSLVSLKCISFCCRQPTNKQTSETTGEEESTKQPQSLWRTVKNFVTNLPDSAIFGIMMAPIAVFFVGYTFSILIYYLFGGLVLGAWYQVEAAIAGMGSSHINLIMTLMKASSTVLSVIDYFMRRFVLKRDKNDDRGKLIEDTIIGTDAAEFVGSIVRFFTSKFS